MSKDLVKQENKVQFIGEQLTPKQLSAKLDSMSAGMEITSEYLEMEDGEVDRFIVIGSGKMPSLDKEKNGDLVPTIRFINREAQSVVSASSVLVSTLVEKAQRVENGEIEPFAVEILCKGKKKNKNNSMYSYLDFSIRLLF